MEGMFRCCFTIWQYAYLFRSPVSSYAQPPPSVLRTSPVVEEQIYYNCGLFMVTVINLHSFDIFLTGMCVYYLSLSLSLFHSDGNEGGSCCTTTGSSLIRWMNM